MALRLILKGRVRAHRRRTKSGKVVLVHEYWRRDRPGAAQPIPHRMPPEGSGEVIRLQVDEQQIWRMFAEKTYGSESPAYAIREAWQNARDAVVKRGRGAVTIEVDRENHAAAVDDTGVGMDEHTLRHKFLTLGASGKEFDTQAVGGFGVAKAVILTGLGKHWRLHTRDLGLDDSMLGVATEFRREPHREGTRIEWTGVDGDELYYMRTGLVYVAMSDWPRGVNVRIVQDGRQYELKPLRPPRSPRFEAEVHGARIRMWKLSPRQRKRLKELLSDLHTSVPAGIVIRLNGIAMIIRHAYDERFGTWICDIDLPPDVRPGDERYPMDPHRISLRGKYAGLVDEWHSQIQTDILSAASERETEPDYRDLMDSDVRGLPLAALRWVPAWDRYAAWWEFPEYWQALAEWIDARKAARSLSGARYPSSVRHSHARHARYIIDYVEQSVAYAGRHSEDQLDRADSGLRQLAEQIPTFDWSDPRKPPGEVPYYLHSVPADAVTAGVRAERRELKRNPYRLEDVTLLAIASDIVTGIASAIAGRHVPIAVYAIPRTRRPAEGTPIAEFLRGTGVGINVSELRSAARDPRTLAAFLCAVTAHELSHAEYSLHNEEYASALTSLSDAIYRLYPQVLDSVERLFEARQRLMGAMQAMQPAGSRGVPQLEWGNPLAPRRRQKSARRRKAQRGRSRAAQLTLLSKALEPPLGDLLATLPSAAQALVRRVHAAANRAGLDADDIAGPFAVALAAALYAKRNNPGVDPRLLNDRLARAVVGTLPGPAQLPGWWYREVRQVIARAGRSQAPRVALKSVSTVALRLTR